MYVSESWNFGQSTGTYRGKLPFSKKLKINIKTMLKQIKTILTNNKAKTFYWQTLNSFIVFLVAGLESIDLIEANLPEKLGLAMVLSLFINLSKWINKTYLTK